jgi:integrase
MANKGRSRSGYLYRRWQGKDYPIDDKTVSGKGVICLRYMLNGKTHKKSLKTNDITEAKRLQKEFMAPLLYADEKAALDQVILKANNVQDKIEAIELAQTPPTTIIGAWDTYTDSTERPDSGERTLKDYKVHWKKFTEWLKEKHASIIALNEITQAIASEYASFLMKEKVSPNTFNKRVNFLRLMCDTISEEARLEMNPFEKIKRKKLKTTSKREFTIEELRQIFSTKDKDLKMLLMLGLHTGLRLGDCATLNWGEVDMDRQLIRRIPNKTRSRSPKPVIAGITSSLYAELNTIPLSKRKGFVLPSMARDYVKDAGLITNIVQEHFESCGIRTHKEGTGYITKPDPKDPGKTIKEHTGKRAVVEVGFHSLRHTFVSLHAERGTPQAVIQAIVGHGNPAMTAHYTHIGEDTARRAAGVLDSGIKDAEFEEVRAPLPPWARQLIEQQNSRNWKKIKEELLAT